MNHINTPAEADEDVEKEGVAFELPSSPTFYYSWVGTPYITFEYRRHTNFVIETKELINAEAMRKMYMSGYEFPEWVLQANEWSTFAFSDTIVFYHRTDPINKVRQMITEREPCNMGMDLYFDPDKLLKTFGYSKGAYQYSTKEELMPNIAVYCNATLRYKHIHRKVHVINLVGYAFDCEMQPDYQSIQTTEELVEKYKGVWKLALAAAVRLKTESKISKLKVFNVGGGAFAPPWVDNFIEEVFEPAFFPILSGLSEKGIKVLGYDFENKEFNGGYVPSMFEDPREDIEHTLYVNAWDPWSLIGNGNGGDSSLDGHWGRCTNMAVLGWSITNPCMQFQPVGYELALYHF